MSDLPTHDALLGRPDARRNVEVAPDAYDLLCLVCGGVRGCWRRGQLPTPGICVKCLLCDPRDYWTRDWTRI